MAERRENVFCMVQNGFCGWFSRELRCGDGIYDGMY